MRSVLLALLPVIALADGMDEPIAPAPHDLSVEEPPSEAGASTEPPEQASEPVGRPSRPPVLTLERATGGPRGWWTPR